MATVNLARDWFAPDGTLYLARDNPHTFPAAFDGHLPKSAKEVAAPVVEEEPVKPAKK